jgi:hypothetical protein
MLVTILVKPWRQKVLLLIFPKFKGLVFSFKRLKYYDENCSISWFSGQAKAYLFLAPRLSFLGDVKQCSMIKEKPGCKLSQHVVVLGVK